MSEYTNIEDAITHQEWFSETYVVDLETGRIIKTDE
jgi:hypothetical protein